jgi:hypothetical protein
MAGVSVESLLFVEIHLRFCYHRIFQTSQGFVGHSGKFCSSDRKSLFIVQKRCMRSTDLFDTLNFFKKLRVYFLTFNSYAPAGVIRHLNIALWAPAHLVSGDVALAKS